jgi:hypothetical protein
MRLEQRRGKVVFVDRAELDALEFFRQPAVLNALNANQKADLANRLATFLRLDAERYSSRDLGGDIAARERECVERRLDALEACLAALVGGGGGDVRGDLKQGGHGRRQVIMQQVYAWIGHPATQRAGALNKAPWNVPIGAP